MDGQFSFRSPEETIEEERGVVMPDCGDPARRRTILTLARQASLLSTQTILEEAVSTQNLPLIQNTQRILERALQNNRNENDQVPSFEIQMNQSGKPFDRIVVHDVDVACKDCKPEACIECFWKLYCDMEKTEASIDRFRQAVKAAKDSMLEADACRALRNRSERNRSKVAF